MSDQATLETTEQPELESGKYLTFGLGTSEYGIDIFAVREIIGMMDMTAVPNMPPSIRGIINLRGKIIPVMDLRRRLDMEPTEATEQTCIVIASSGTSEIGLIVDMVYEVREINQEELSDLPSLGGALDTEMIQGVDKTTDRTILLLNIDTIVAGQTPE